MAAVNDVPFSDDEVFNSFTDKDRTTEVVAFVDEIHAPKLVGNKQQFRIFKFALSNNANRKIACCIWGDELINQYEPEIQNQRILHITGGLTKAVATNYLRESEGFVPFEITILPSTHVDYLGFHNVPVAVEPAVPIIVDFKTIKDHERGLINEYIKAITGFLKQTLRSVQNRFGNMSFGSSAITDGIVEVNIIVTNFATLDVEVGTQVTVTGELNYNGGLTTITCRDIDAFVPHNDVERMPLANLLRANRFPRGRILQQ